MSLDLTLLRTLKHRDKYDKVRRAVPLDPLDPKTRTIVADIDTYFKEYPQATGITLEDFEQFWLLFCLRHPSLTEEQKSTYAKTLKLVFGQDADKAIEDGLMARLLQAASVQRVAEAAQRYGLGEEVDWAAVLPAEAEWLTKELQSKVDNPFVSDDIEAQLQGMANDRGIHWRLDCLNEAFRPLMPGDFGILAARPDRGKTTLVASEVTFMAPQVPLHFEQDRPIIWFNNEGPGQRIWARIYQAALGATSEQLRDWSADGTLRDRYVAAVGGANRIRIADIHGRSNHDVENYIRKHRPAICVFDMIDNIRFAGLGNNNGQRTDQLLEAMYSEGREWCVKYEAIGLATSQLSADAEGEMYPRQDMLKDSKTGKQGACDFIVTLGENGNPLFADRRYIGSTKHKNLRTGARPPHCEVLFRPDVSRVEMPKENA